MYLYHFDSHTIECMPCIVFFLVLQLTRMAVCVLWLFLTVTWVGLQCIIVVYLALFITTDGLYTRPNKKNAAIYESFLIIKCMWLLETSIIM